MAVRYAATATWTAGRDFVDSQLYTWSQAGNVLKEGTLGPTETSRDSEQDEVTVGPNENLTFAVRSKNEFGESDPVSATGTAPTPLPDGPTNVALTFRQTSSGT